jgi:acylglycerol lipase
MQNQTSRFKNKDGLSIFTRTWLPQGKAQAVVVVVPGFNSHSGYYEWVAAQLVTQHYAVYAIDLRGRGQSDGERFYIQSFDDYVSDIDQLMDIARTQQSGLPVFLLGHSAGGVFSCLYALEHADKINGLICEDFAFQTPAPDFVLAVLKGLAYAAPHAHVVKLKNADFSRDPKVVEAMNNDPLINTEIQPNKTMEQLVRADERLKKEFPQITMPVFILHGTADKAAKASGSQFFYDMVGSKDKTLKFYEGGYHDLLNDLDKETVMADINQWLAKHI